MPIYEWKCPKCGQRAERFMSHPCKAMEQKCVACGELMRYEFSPPAIHFKGSGWQTPQPKEEKNGSDV